MNDAVDSLTGLPALHKVICILLNPVPGQLIMGDKLNSAMKELLTVYYKLTDNNQNLNPAQKAVGMHANQPFVCMVYDSIISRLRIVSYYLFFHMKALLLVGVSSTSIYSITKSVGKQLLSNYGKSDGVMVSLVC